MKDKPIKNTPSRKPYEKTNQDEEINIILDKINDDYNNSTNKEFYKKLKDPGYKEKAYYDFALVKQLKVSGFPTAFIQIEEGKFYLIARGYTEYENLKNSIDKILTA